MQLRDSKRQLVITLLGLFLVGLFGFLVLYTLWDEAVLDLRRAASTIFLSLMATSLITLVVQWQVVNPTERRLKKFDAAIKLIPIARELGVIDSYQSLFAEDAIQEQRKIIKNATDSRALTVRIVGTSDPPIFRDKDFVSLVSKRLSQGKLKLQLILCDRNSLAFEIRAQLDDEVRKKNTNSSQHSGWEGPSYIEQWASEYSTVVKIWRIDFHPVARLVLTNDIAFWQPYHLGLREWGESADQYGAGGVELCLVATKGSLLYEHAEEQFNAAVRRAQARERGQKVHPLLESGGSS